MTPDDPRLLRAVLAGGVTFLLVLAMGVLIDRQFYWDIPCLGTRALPATLFALLAAVEARRRWGLSVGWTVLMVASYNIDLTIVLWLFFPACLAPTIFSAFSAMLLVLMPVLTVLGWFAARERT